MRVPKVAINFRITERELAILRAYADERGRSQTDVIREYIRSLESDL